MPTHFHRNVMAVGKLQFESWTLTPNRIDTHLMLSITCGTEIKSLLGKFIDTDLHLLYINDLFFESRER